jgi:hypothetical protein
MLARVDDECDPQIELGELLVRDDRRLGGRQTGRSNCRGCC